MSADPLDLNEQSAPYAMEDDAPVVVTVPDPALVTVRADDVERALDFFDENSGPYALAWASRLRAALSSAASPTAEHTPGEQT